MVDSNRWEGERRIRSRSVQIPSMVDSNSSSWGKDWCNYGVQIPLWSIVTGPTGLKEKMWTVPNSSMVDSNWNMNLTLSPVWIVQIPLWSIVTVLTSPAPLQVAGSNSSMVDSNCRGCEKDEMHVPRSNSSMVDSNRMNQMTCRCDNDVQIPLWSIVTGFAARGYRNSSAFKFLYGR